MPPPVNIEDHPLPSGHDELKLLRARKRSRRGLQGKDALIIVRGIMMEQDQLSRPHLEGHSHGVGHGGVTPV